MRAAFALFLLRFRMNRIYFVVQLVINICLPIAFVLVIAQSQTEAMVPRLVLSAFVIGAVFSVFRLPAIILAMERLFSTRELLATTHITRTVYLASNVIDGAYYALFPLVALMASAWLMGIALPISPLFWGVLLLYLWVLHSGAVLLACWRTSLPTMGLMVNLVMTASIALAPVYYPLENVPALIRPIVEWWPPTLAMEVGVRAMGGGGVDILHVGALAAWGVFLTALGYTLFPWTDTGGE